MLNSFEHFSVPALAPVAWNAVIIAALVGLIPVLSKEDEIYAYAIGVLVGSLVQFLLPLPLAPRSRRPLHLHPAVAQRARQARAQADAPRHDRPRADQPGHAGQLADRHARLRADAGGDRQAFRVYQLPQGLFSIAIATILFPTLSRFAAEAR